MTLTMGSLFDGIGGFPLAAARFGINTVWASEIEAFPIEVTLRRFPSMAHKGDITKLSGKLLFPVDIICGGSPCQDLSVAGARQGLSGARSGLFMEQIRVTKELRDEDIRRGRTAEFIRPRWFIWENVPGAFSSGTPKYEDFRIVLEEIVGLTGYPIHVPRPHPWPWRPAGRLRVGTLFSLAWRVFDAQYWPRTPQRRRRIFLVADLGGLTAPKILFEQESLPGYPAACAGTGQRAAASPQGGFDGAGGAGLMTPQPDVIKAYHINQRDEGIDLHGVAGALMATSNLQMQTFVTAAFSAGAGASAGSVAYSEQIAPTLKGTASGNCMPSVLCLNDQGGSVLDCSEDVSGTLRAQEHGHQPLVYENYGIDARYTGPHPVSPTLSARAGTGGNNLPLVEQDPAETLCITGNAIDRQPQNGGNGIGYQEDISYTLTATDHHAVFSRQRADKFSPSDVASTESARQHKDATDLVSQAADTDTPLLIRRLTPLECERLQGFPDGWTDLAGASDSARYRALGNSVAIPCVEHIMRGIVMAAGQS